MWTRFWRKFDVGKGRFKQRWKIREILYLKLEYRDPKC